MLAQVRHHLKLVSAKLMARGTSPVWSPVRLVRLLPLPAAGYVGVYDRKSMC